MEDLSDRQRNLEACVISLSLLWVEATGPLVLEVCFVSLWELLRRLGKERGYQRVMGTTTDTNMRKELGAGEEKFVGF